MRVKVRAGWKETQRPWHRWAWFSSSLRWEATAGWAPRALPTAAALSGNAREENEQGRKPEARLEAPGRKAAAPEGSIIPLS